jgi:hypothetical protein
MNLFLPVVIGWQITQKFVGEYVSQKVFGRNGASQNRSQAVDGRRAAVHDANHFAGLEELTKS